MIHKNKKVKNILKLKLLREAKLLKVTCISFFHVKIFGWKKLVLDVKWDEIEIYIHLLAAGNVYIPDIIWWRDEEYNMMASFQNLLLQGFFFISRIIFFHLQKQLLEVILHLCIKEGFFLLKHSCIFFFPFENWKGNTYEICCFDMLSIRNLFLLNLIVLYKANFFLFLTLLFKVIFRSVFINGLYFCRIFIQQCTCIHVYLCLFVRVIFGVM